MNHGVEGRVLTHKTAFSKSFVSVPLKDKYLGRRQNGSIIMQLAIT
jgi:hypothetical protein